MPSVTNEQLKGNFAENLVAEWISRVCLVRTVSAGTDIGIDLYCESLIENNPHLHFWVQVKAISEKEISIKNGTTSASYRFKRNHLEYWARQPIPVYGFLVPVIGWPPKYPERIYGVPLTRYVVENGLPKTDTIKIETSECTEFASIDQDWEQFVTEIVPADSAILLMSRGLISNIEFPNSEYPHFPRGIALKYSEKILDYIRDAVMVLGSETLENENDDYVGIRHLCESLGTFFIRKTHIMGINFLVDSALKDKDGVRALSYVNKVQKEIESRKDIDEATIAEYISKLEPIRQKIAKT